MFGLGVPEILIILLIILLIFGAKRLPGIGAGLGKTVKEVRNIKKEWGGNKKSAKATDTTEGSASEDKSIEDKLSQSVQDKLTNKIIEQVPGIRQAKKIKDKADKIKRIIS